MAKFGISKDGKVFCRVDIQPIRYESKEPIKDPSGKTIGYRTQVKEQPQEPIDKTPEECGWFKKVTWETVILLIIPNPKNHFRPEPQLFYQKYEVDVDKYLAHNPCNYCIDTDYGSRFHYIRDMPSGIYHVCVRKAIRFGVTASGPMSLISDIHTGKLCSWVKLLEEKPMTKQEAQIFFRKTEKKPNLNVAMFLSGSEFV